MFGKNKETNDRYFEGLCEGKAKAYTRIIDVLETHPAQEDAYAVLMAVKILCEYELRDNPYARNIKLFKRETKEL